ncbi:MAG: bifunctional phosphoribosylaminoimidazolecarboxamide formyltransferase/IMP cyclohydrolase, partial [Eubacteriales bacterium]|nr:bifunctional phosphoribosylaminoimidazolecarboxamide formyltransferase/IMP cyclohydrolase [Eubacteriales bacterium]
MKRALISVSDKTGLIELAQTLSKSGYELVSTGGTAERLQSAGISVTPVSSVTGFPECLDGRVKTLHPKIHGGILAIRDNPDHMRTLAELQIEPIDLLVINLYPFRETVMKEGVTQNQCIEQIDIGGPSMLRAAAKNFHDVTVLVDPQDYARILTEISQDGSTTLQTRRYLARKVFEHTASYDAMIAEYFKTLTNEDPESDLLTIAYERVETLRY